MQGNSLLIGKQTECPWFRKVEESADICRQEWHPFSVPYFENMSRDIALLLLWVTIHLRMSFSYKAAFQISSVTPPGGSSETIAATVWEGSNNHGLHHLSFCGTCSTALTCSSNLEGFLRFRFSLVMDNSKLRSHRRDIGLIWEVVMQNAYLVNGKRREKITNPSFHSFLSS